MGRGVLKAASMTLISVAVVSSPVKAHQSLTTRPAPMTSEPRFTVPAYVEGYLDTRRRARRGRGDARRAGSGAGSRARPGPG
jgi:hypothetical protein